MEQKLLARPREGGLSMIGFLFGIIVVAVLAVVGMKVVPTYAEYSAIKKAIANAKEAGTTPTEIKAAFNKQRDTSYIESVEGNDLEIEKTGDGFEVSIAYEKKIGLVGPVSLLIDYVATTARNGLN